MLKWALAHRAVMLGLSALTVISIVTAFVHDGR